MASPRSEAILFIIHIFISRPFWGCFHVELIPHLSEGEAPKIGLKDETLERNDKRQAPLCIGFPWFAYRLILEIVLNH